MRCHNCEREAAVTAESGGLTVGLCAEHFRERIEGLTDSPELAAIEEQLENDPTE